LLKHDVDYAAFVKLPIFNASRYALTQDRNA